MTKETLRITSVRENTMFRMLHIHRQLDGPLAESLIAVYDQLAAAVRRFPNGMESIAQEAEERPKMASGASCGGGFIMAGDPRDFASMKALMEATKNGDFGPSIKHALEHDRDDTTLANSNQAPKEFWPSICSFRSILYSAGKRMGKEAEGYLDRILDNDIRLFARIEFAAALAGLPELQGPQRRSRRRQDRLRTGSK